MKDGGQALFNALKAKGYKKMGGEKSMLVKMMQMGGVIDMSDQFVETMRYGGSKMNGKKMQIGGQLQARTNSKKK